MGDQLYALAMAVLLLAIACAAWYFATKCRHGTIPYGSWFGQRSRATTASPQAWRAGHVAIAPFARAIAILGGIAAGLCAFAAGVAPTPADSKGLAWGVSLVYLIVLIVIGAIMIAAANRAARAVTPAGEPPPTEGA